MLISPFGHTTHKDYCRRPLSSRNGGLPNLELQKTVDTSDDWIVERTGIRERRVAAKGQATSDLAVEAAKSLLKKRGIDASEIDLIIVGTVTPDMFFPSTGLPGSTQNRRQKGMGIRFVRRLLRLPLCPADGSAVHRCRARTKKFLVIGADVMTSNHRF
jgi:3-oxoacyl-[acyl-carrier-protein] synthase-3